VSAWEERLAEQRSAVRLLFDENLPPSLKRHLADLFPNSVHVREIDLARFPDLAIWDYAKAFNLAILTKDSDFALRVRHEGPPPSVIQVRAGNCSVGKLVVLIRENAPKIVLHVQFGGPLLEIGSIIEAAASAPPSTESPV
jgi:predicted nuclease of predicted toxin-antitoxin system